MGSDTARAWAELESLDLALETVIPGQSDEVGALLDRRELAIATIASAATTLEELEELAARQRRITERFLHWRRVALVDLAQLDQHLRFLEAHPQAETAHSVDFRG